MGNSKDNVLIGIFQYSCGELILPQDWSIRIIEHLEAGEQRLPPKFPMNHEYYNWIELLYKKNWVIYSKPPFGGVHNVVKY